MSSTVVPEEISTTLGLFEGVPDTGTGEAETAFAVAVAVLVAGVEEEEGNTAPVGVEEGDGLMTGVLEDELPRVAEAEGIGELELVPVRVVEDDGTGVAVPEGEADAAPPLVAQRFGISKEPRPA